MKCMPADLSGKRVLVTGATGFIGGRLVERLVLEEGARVRALVRNFARAPRIARFNIEMVPGDILDREATTLAVQGCEIVFHCAWGDRSVNIEGTRNVLDAAASAGVERVVHLSTISVYGDTSDGDLSESAPRQRTGDEYGDSKSEGESLALSYYREHSLPVVVIQPTVVYGPFASAWTVGVLQELKTGRVMLVNNGDGLSNAVYVDDVVSAMLLSAKSKDAVGEAFLIAGPDNPTWRDFYGMYERMLGTTATVSMTLAEARAYARKQKRGRSVRQVGLEILRQEPQVRKKLFQAREISLVLRAAQAVIPEQKWEGLKAWIKGEAPLTGRPSTASGEGRTPIPLDDTTLRFYASKTQVCIEKAKRVLGYKPAFELEPGMRLTQAWADWANLL